MQKNYFEEDKPNYSPIPKRTERGKLNDLNYLNHVNLIKKENQDLKNGLRQLNKSLDKILKSSKASNPARLFCSSNEPEDSMSKKIESTELLIQKYKKELSTLRESHNTQDLADKVRINKEIAMLKAQIHEFETENLKIMKTSQKVTRIDDRQLKLELKTVKDRYNSLQELIKEDEKLISEFKDKVETALNEKKKKGSEEFVEGEGETDLEVLKTRIYELEITKKQEEAGWKSKITEMKKVVEEKEKEIADLEVIIKEKDRNCRVKKMRVKAQQRENRGNNLIKAREEVSN